MRFTDPIAFEEYLAPIGGEVNIRPMKGDQFRAKINMRMMQAAGLFTIDADSFFAQKAPQQDFFGFTIPLNAPFVVSESGTDQAYGRHNAHLLSPDNPFTFKCEKNCHAMACNIFVDPLTQYKERVLQESSSSKQQFPNANISLISAEGSKAFRTMVRAWVALGTDSLSINAMFLREIEDDLLSSFLLLVEEAHAQKKETRLPARFAIGRTEEYISANLEKVITRDDLADVANVSIRSLSRGFKGKYGLGPMEYVRQRRLDACYGRLRGSGPSETTISEVAMSHGFGHIGKFAITYKQAFGEAPSTTLREK
jgi:AraC-like DNA-binding protein